MHNLKTFKSGVLQDYFASFIKTVKFYRDKISIVFEFNGTFLKTQLKNFETEVGNILQISGFKQSNISIITNQNCKPDANQNLESTKALVGVKNMICVASCKGGVGKSTVAINLAMDFAEKGYKVGLLDGDIYGPSIPIMLGMENVESITENGRIIPIMKDNIKIVSIGFMVKNENALMWRGPMITKAIRGLFEGTLWGELDLLVVDLPPGTGDIYISLLTSYQVNGVLMVSSPHTVSVQELKKTIQLFKKFNIKILGIVENMIEKDDESLASDFKVKRKEFQKDGFVKMNLDFTEKIKLKK